MSDITDIKNWPEDRLVENKNDDDDLCMVKYAEQQQRVKVKKVEKEWRKVVEEATWRAVEEARRCKAEEVKRRAEEVVEAAVRRQVSLFGDQSGCWLTKQAEQVAEQQ